MKITGNLFFQLIFVVSPIFAALSSYIFNFMGGPISSAGQLARDYMSSGSDDGMFGFLIIIGIIPALFIFFRNKILKTISFIFVFFVYSIITWMDFFWEVSSFDLELYPDGRLLILYSGYILSWGILAISFFRFVKTILSEEGIS